MIAPRRFITLIGEVLVTPPTSTLAQQPATAVIGFLNNLSAGARLRLDGWSPLTIGSDQQRDWPLPKRAHDEPRSRDRGAISQPAGLPDDGLLVSCRCTQVGC